MRALIVAVALALGVAACHHAQPKKQYSMFQKGLGTYYGKEAHGGPTASGERFNMHAMTAAHRSLPMGTRVRVTNKRNGKSVVVRINDRGPYGRAIIDLSQAAAAKLDMLEAGVVPVTIEVVK